MRNAVKKLVEQVFHLSENKEEYIKKVNEKMPLSDKIKSLLERYGYEYSYHDYDNSVRTYLSVKLESYCEGVYSIEYSFWIEFSKISKVRKDLFQFEIVDRNPDNMTGDVLYGDDSEPLTKKQFNFYRELNSILDVDTEHLDYRDLHEVLCEQGFVEPAMKFFNEQPNVDTLLFHDFFCYIDNVGDDMWLKIS